MDFGLSGEQEQLRKSAADFLAAKAPTAHARRVAAGASEEVDDLWAAMVGLGWPGLALPEQQGGSGLGLLELTLVLEEMGAVVMPGPFLSATVLGARTVALVGQHSEREELLPELAAGRRRVTLALAESRGCWRFEDMSSVAEAFAGGWRLTCHKLFVPDAGSADTVLVAAMAGGAPCLFLVEREQLDMRQMLTVDATRELYEISCTGLELGAERMLGGGPLEAVVAARLLAGARVALAAELCGQARAALAMSLEHVSLRQQFGRPVGSFQAVQHKCADMQVAVENSRSLVYYAAWALDEKLEDAPLVAAMAKAYASDSCPRVVEDALQVHGGMGFTQEHDLHLFLKRAKASQTTFGDGVENRERVAGLLGL